MKMDDENDIVMVMVVVVVMVLFYRRLERRRQSNSDSDQVPRLQNSRNSALHLGARLHATRLEAVVLAEVGVFASSVRVTHGHPVSGRRRLRAVRGVSRTYLRHRYMVQAVIPKFRKTFTILTYSKLVTD